LYRRSNDPGYFARVNDFRLDLYEVSVGRFRKFVAAYSQTMTPSGAGTNPANPFDPGWNKAWDANLPATVAELTSSSGLKCHINLPTWTDTPGANELRPINCVNWYLAFAFCAWDGGRLPTEAEWNYAAAGGAEQKEYPWSSPPSSKAIDCGNASYWKNSSEQCCGDGSPNCGLTDLLDVGTKPLGYGRWGQGEMSGNVSEWVLDLYADPYPDPSCTNCANLTQGSARVVRGGYFLNDAATVLTWSRTYRSPSVYSHETGFRCARSAP
jgi:formylglycine-generating enzyme required for sulfatase activity